MPLSRSEMLFDEQVQLLTRPCILDCANRRGLREQTGQMLEQAFLDLAVAIAPDLSVEIGAHEAGFSIGLKHRLPQVRAWAFEANPYVYDKFMNAADRSIELIAYKNAAISSKTGFVDLKIPTGWAEGSFGTVNAISSLRSRSNTDAQFEYQTERVASFTLDDALAEIDFASAVAWVDVEGAQEDVLKGGPRFFSRASALYIEVETAEVWRGQMTETALNRRLAEFGFLPVMRDNLARVQFNGVYVRNDGAYAAFLDPIVETYTRKLRGLTG